MENVGSVDAGRGASTRCGGAREEKVKAARAQMRRPEALRLRPTHTTKGSTSHNNNAIYVISLINRHTYTIN